MEVGVHLVHVKSISLEPSVMEHSGHVRLQNVRSFENHWVDCFELA